MQLVCLNLLDVLDDVFSCCHPCHPPHQFLLLLSLTLVVAVKIDSRGCKRFILFILATEIPPLFFRNIKEEMVQYAEE